MKAALMHYLKPDLRTVMFACKGLSAVTLALAVSMNLDLDKPFWAMVASMMLQARPEAGLVIEKAACLILGSTVGAVIAILILDNLTPYPGVAIGALTLCVAATSVIASTMRHVNFVFATALVSVTAILIVLFSMADPANASSESIFLVVRARLGEVLIGASCATLASVLLYPFKVETLLKVNTHRLLGSALTHLHTILQGSSSPAALHQQRMNIIALAAALNDDVNAGWYDRAGNIDAALLTANKALTIIAWSQTVERIVGNSPKKLPDLLASFVNRLAQSCNTLNHLSPSARLQTIESCGPSEETRDLAQRDALASALIESLDKVAEALSAMLAASLPLIECASVTKRFPRFMRHRDWLVGIRSAFRNSLVFLSAMGIWILSDEPASLIMMIVLPVLFSQMFAASPSPRVVVRKLLSGTLIAIPVAIFFVLVLLAKGSSDFESLMLVLAPPLFLGLMALTSPALTPYGLGFCLTLAVLVQPSNYMTFAVDQGLSTGLGVAAGLSLLYAGFYLLGPPKGAWLQKRIFKDIYSDLKKMRKNRLPADWLNHRAAERLSYLGAYEPIDPAGRALTERGLRALETGHCMVFTRNRQAKNIL